jgi:hypothetical protein
MNAWRLRAPAGVEVDMALNARLRWFLVLILIVGVITAGGCAKSASTPQRDGAGMSGNTLNSFTDFSGTKSAASVPSVATEQVASADRKIIFNASLALDVLDAEKTLSTCELLVVKYGGFVAQSSLQKSDTRVVGTATLRVPAEKVNQLMDSLAELGTVTSRSSGSEDITSQYIDLQARLKVLRAEEEQLVTFLKKAADIKEMLAVQEQLRAVRTEIEQDEGQQRYMDNATSLATVTVQLVQTTEAFVAPRGFGSAFVQSLVRFGHGLAAFWTWLGGSIVFIVFYGLLLWALAWVALRMMRRRAHKDQPPQV